MCLDVPRKQKALDGPRHSQRYYSPEPLIASDHIICYKRVHHNPDNKGQYIPCHYPSIRYTQNTCYYDKKAFSDKKVTWNRYYLQINRAFHSYGRVSQAHSVVGDTVSIMCVIPKGSVYYYSDGEYASNQLIILNHLRINPKRVSKALIRDILKKRRKLCA